MEFVIFFVLVVINLFLAKEFFKKGSFLKDFLDNSPKQVIIWEYEGKTSREPGMYNIILTGNIPFSVLLGFDLKVFGYTIYDPYGSVSSNNDNQIVISTYLGSKPVIFRFLTNVPCTEILFSSSTEDQKLIPMRTYQPHWWQQIGFYG